MTHPDAQALRSEGRRAEAASEWDRAFTTLSAADVDGLLSADDLRALAESAYLTGRVDTAVDALSRAFEAHRGADELTEAVRSGSWVIFILSSQGAAAQASGWGGRLASVLAHLPAGDPAHAYLRLLEAFRAVAVDHRNEEGHAIANGVVEVARAIADRDLLAMGLNIDGRALVRSGAIEDGMRRLDEAMVEVSSGELSGIVTGTVYCSMIEACEEIAEFARAREWTHVLADWCARQQGMVTFNGQCLTHRAGIMRRSGRLDDAIAEVERARHQFAGAADEQATGRALYELGEIHRVRADHPAAEQAYLEAAQWGHDPQPGLALLRLDQGRVDQAAGTMRRLMSTTTEPIDRLAILPAHIDVMLAAGDRDEAEQAAGELGRLAGTYRSATTNARLRRALGRVALARGDTDKAIDALRSAVDSWRTIGVPYEEAKGRLLLADAYRRAGDSDGAHVEEEAGRRTLADLGIAAGDDASDAHGLSPRELDVLRLVATGMTNREIADQLYLAVRTIDRHVANILTKLDVRSRTAATSYAYEHGLV